MKTEVLKKGTIFKNYKEFCKLVEIKPTTGTSKISQFKELERFCEYHKEGQKIIIDKIYKIPKDKEDKRCNPKYDILTDRERNNEFDGYYVYAHIMDGKYMYIGKGCKARAINSMYQRFNKEDYDKIEIKILARFENEIDALEYEENKINYYQSIGQCKLNDDKCYHQGKTKMDNTNKKILNKIDKLIKQKELMMKKIDGINDEINKLYEQLTKK